MSSLTERNEGDSLRRVAADAGGTDRGKNPAPPIPGPPLDAEKGRQPALCVEGLGRLPSGTILDERRLAGMFGCHPATIKRAVSRGELPAPTQPAQGPMDGAEKTGLDNGVSRPILRAANGGLEGSGDGKMERSGTPS